MSFEDKLQKIILRYNYINDKLSQTISVTEIAKLSKEQSEISNLVETASIYFKIQNDIKSLDEMLNDSALDTELKELALSEKYNLQKKINEIKHNIKILLLPKNTDDERGAIIEIRAGAGGEESALFASVLFRMYKYYSEYNGWKFDILHISETGLYGYKEASACISGKGVFARMKFESGVHRVQRVPETESSGRIHTSTVTVAVLPEVEDIDINIDEKDLKIDSYRASGAGGQHVNTTDSAIRITHIPTGIVVCQQDEKSQHKNKSKALKILRAKLYEAEKGKQNAERSATRKEQIGTGDRSERIRTYNYTQNRVTDHRIGLTLYSLTQIINEGKLDCVIDPLIANNQASMLAQDGIDGGA